MFDKKFNYNKTFSKLTKINIFQDEEKETPKKKMLNRKESEEYLTLEYPVSVKKNLKGIVLPDDQKIATTNKKIPEPRAATRQPGHDLAEAGKTRKLLKHSNSVRSKEGINPARDSLINLPHSIHPLITINIGYTFVN